MAKRITGLNIPLNRAEGDLEVLVDVDGGVITEAKSSGTMFRGFEEMMLGRGALDGLVITPRICGICSLTHLTAAAEALDAICKVTPPDNARRLRNLALMVETVQSDVRHAALMFMVDFVNEEAYEDHPLFQEAQFRYSPAQGMMTLEVIKETKRLLKVAAIIGGQWPHTSFMVPGGVTSIPDATKLLQCGMIIKQFRTWYESTVLGCPIEEWLKIESLADLDNWLAESIEHRESEVGFFTRIARESGIDQLGYGPNRFLSFGNLPLPVDTAVTGSNGRLVSAGFAEGTTIHPFDQHFIHEDISHSWYEQDAGLLHPFDGVTKPHAVGQGSDLYSWVKAPRYDGKVVETGPLAEQIIDGNPLFHDLLKKNGPNIFSRQLARLTRPAYLLPTMSIWADELIAHYGDTFYKKVGKIPNGRGAGLIQAARGALGHWVKIADEKIMHYQVITPSAWNGSPRDKDGNRGAWEEALMGTAVKNTSNPVEAGHVVRSFDPCLVCAVHAVQKNSRQ